MPQVWSHRCNILRFFYGINFILTIAIRTVEVSHFIDEKAEVLWKGSTSQQSALTSRAVDFALPFPQFTSYCEMLARTSLSV